MPWHYKTTTIALLLFTLSPLAVREVRPQPRIEEFRGSPSAYGITYDGTNFWYSDPTERRVVRVPPTGRPQTFRMGNQAFFGMAFNPADGFLYVGSERKLLRVNTVTGGLDSTLPIPVPEIGGIAFGGALWYILERDTGILHYYDPK
ncbi:MAG: hypothetical protein HY042_10580, partial [Spirochaetia bacterium]|nr:hypothetical protein [Spirochaetia bacterium]